MYVCLLMRGYVCGERVCLSVSLWVCVCMGTKVSMYICEFVCVCVVRGCVYMSVSSWVGVCMGPRCVCMFVIVWWEGWPGELLALGMGQKCACMSVSSWVCSCGEEGGGVGGFRSGRCSSFF